MNCSFCLRPMQFWTSVTELAQGSYIVFVIASAQLQLCDPVKKVIQREICSVVLEKIAFPYNLSFSRFLGVVAVVIIYA
jgi:hypothetical protein